MAKALDLTGQRFGRLTAISPTYERGPHREILWRCRCDCGNETVVRGTTLRNGETRSCGCLRLELVTTKNKERAKKVRESKPNPVVEELRRPVDKSSFDDLWMFGDHETLNRRWYRKFLV